MFGGGQEADDRPPGRMSHTFAGVVGCLAYLLSQSTRIVVDGVDPNGLGELTHQS
jgi:hypothetical protein